MNFTKLLNNQLDILEQTAIQDESGQVFQTWSPVVSNIPCRKDIAPKDYQITDTDYKNIKEKYIFFIDKKYKSQVTRLNRISCESQEYAILDVMSFDSTSKLHHIEIYAVKAELGKGAGFGGFAVDPNQFAKKTQTVNGKQLTGDITLSISDIPSLQSNLDNIQTELNSKQDITTNYDDKTYQQNFTAQSTITVSHNLNKYPSVTIIDSAGSQILGDVTYISQNELVIEFTSATGGTVYCN